MAVGALILLTTLLAAARAAPAPAPQDASLMKDFDAQETYEAMEALRGRLDVLTKELAALGAAHAGKAEPAPGGARREEVRAEVVRLMGELKEKREAFRELGNDRRMQRVIVMMMQVKEGKNDSANESFQSAVRQSQIVGEYKQYARSVQTVLDEEALAYGEAVARWTEREEARRRRRRTLLGSGAAAVLLAAAVYALRRRAARLKDLEDGRLGRWLPRPPARPWEYGLRFDGSDGGGGTVASVRVFDARFAADPERLLGALKAAQPPAHPGLARPLEALAAAGSVVLVYPASAAKPLSVWLEEGRGVRPDKAVLFLRRLAAPLDAAHRAGKAHGGLRPDCVLVGADGSVVLEDFGIASALAALGLPRAGSPAYAAPELDASPPGPAADLYSAGVMLYELLTGRHPFEGTNLPVMKREKRFTPLSRSLPACPAGLDALMDALLEPDPARRRAAGGLEAALKALS